MRCRLAWLCAALLLTTAASAEPVKGGRANVVVQPEPPSLMLGIAFNTPTYLVAGNIYESLLRFDHDLKPLPQLATSWDVSDDGKTYTFKLREGVRWHDGQPFTSKDVAFSVDVFLRQTNPRVRSSIGALQSVETPDDHTVVFNLKEPFGPFAGIFNVVTTPMIPRHIYEGTDFQNNPANSHPIGTGPFKFGEWIRGSHILLRKNEEYYEDGKPYLDEIYWHVIPDAAARSVAYETGVVDILPGGSIENFDVPRVSGLENSCMTDKGSEIFAPHSWLWINNRNGPMADVRFRRAIMHALDRQFARDALWNGLGNVATGPVGSATRFYSDDVTKYPFDPTRARELLAEMGYDGKSLRLLPLPYGETWLRWAEIVKQNLVDVGINVEIVSTDFAGWSQRLSQWDFDLAFTYFNQFGDPALGVTHSYLSSNIAQGSPWNNVAGYVNPEINRLFAEASSAFPDENRAKIYAEAQKILVDDVPVAWLLELSFPVVHRCNIKNLTTTATGLIGGFKDAYIER